MPHMTLTARYRRAEMWHACTRKVRHADWEAAEARCLAIYLLNGENLYAYHCRFCDGYHTAHHESAYFRARNYWWTYAFCLKARYTVSTSGELTRLSGYGDRVKKRDAVCRAGAGDETHGKIAWGCGGFLTSAIKNSAGITKEIHRYIHRDEHLVR